MRIGGTLIHRPVGQLTLSPSPGRMIIPLAIIETSPNVVTANYMSAAEPSYNRG
jgi:hypothetical protein